MLTSNEYYKSKAVRHRILEYCGVKKELMKKCPLIEGHLREMAESATSEYLVGWGQKIKREKGKDFEAIFNYNLHGF